MQEHSILENAPTGGRRHHDAASGVIRGASRRSEEQEARRQTGLEETTRAFREGIANGSGRLADEVFDSLEEKYSGMIDGQATDRQGQR
uniref:Uncharacterized protein n=1 Tax=Candidatus Kentrum sp. TUN TaxID=2126343 RepID=A0A451A8G3_9GAMM|nr:MAG: hypothetical protein BECKTUN1418D_GA0071000_11727 [Candidatus Kentron sp. TUN]